MFTCLHVYLLLYVLEQIRAILVFEMFFNLCLRNSSSSLSSFQLIPADRASFSRGGAAIFVAIFLLQSSVYHLNSLHTMFLEVTLSHHKVPWEARRILCSFPWPNVLMGDVTCLVKMILGYVFFYLLITRLTYISLPNCTPYLLDLIVVSSPELVTMHGQFTADAFHDFLYLLYVCIRLNLKFLCNVILQFYTQSSQLTIRHRCYYQCGHFKSIIEVNLLVQRLTRQNQMYYLLLIAFGSYLVLILTP